MHTILIVEDDVNISSLLRETLEREGYACVQAFSGTEARMLLSENSYAVVLLDLMLPGISGEEVLKEIRQRGKTPVIVLTAKDTIDDKVEFLRSGADDYVTKPFDIKEVAARVEVQIRRMGGETKDKAPKELQYQGLVLDKEGFRVNVEGRELAKITKQEFAILELLLKHPKKVFSKEEIFEYAWDEPYMGETKTLDVHISNIRKKIKEVSEKEYIETVWGIGYRLHP
ncbi:MAG: response regulator transcription factor [Bacillota bacterium]|nr:response regulator transcription factor [Bacillota bacterium]